MLSAQSKHSPLEEVFIAANVGRQAIFTEGGGVSIFMMVHDRSVDERRSRSKPTPRRHKVESREPGRAGESTIKDTESDKDRERIRAGARGTEKEEDHSETCHKYKE